MLISAAIVIAALAAVLALAPALVDTAPMRERVVAEASRALGHPVRVAGAVRLRLLPRPALTLEDVHVHEPQRDGGADLLAARRVDLEPAFGALLRGEVRLDALRVEHAEAWLRRDGGGRWNWTLDAAAGAGGEPRVIEGRDLALHVADGDRDVTLALDRVAAERADDSALTGSMHGRLSGLDAHAAPTVLLDALGARDGGLAIDARFAVGPGPVFALSQVTLGEGSDRASGALRVDWPRRRVEADLSLPAFALSGDCPVPAGEHADGSSQPGPWPALGGWSGALDLRVGTLRAAGADLRDLKASAVAGDARLTLSAEAGGDTLEVSLERDASSATAARLALRATPGTARAVLACLGLPRQEPAVVNGAEVLLEASGQGWREMLDGAAGHVRIAGPPAAGAAPWTPLGMDAEIAAGRVAGAQLRFAHPPGAPLVVNGSGGRLLGLVQGEWPFEARWNLSGKEGEVQGSVVSSDGARSAHGTFRAGRGAAAPGDAALSGTGRWAIERERIAFSALDIEVSGNTLTGDLVLDASASPIAVTGHLRLAAASLEWLASLAPAGTPGGAGLPAFAIDGLRVQIASLEGLPFAVRDLDTRLATRGDDLRFDPLAVDMLSARWTGDVALNVAADPPTARYALVVEQVPLAGVPAFAGLPLEVREGRQVEIEGRWSGSDFAAVSSSLEFDASGDRLVLQAPPAVGGGELVLERVTARFRPRDGLAVSGLARLRDEELEMDLAAAPRDEGAGWRVKGSARGAVGELRAAGDVGGDGAVDVSGKGPDLGRLLAIAGAGGPGPGGAWTVSARVAQDGDAVVLAPLAVSADAIGSLSGDARLQTGERPRLTARLASQRLDLSGLAGPAELPPAPDGRRIPDVALPDPPDPGLDADVSVTAAEVVGLPARIGDVRARLRSDATRLALEDVHASLDDGAVLTGRIATEAADPARAWSLEIDATGVDLGVFITHGIDADPIGWPADATLRVDGAGGRLHALLASARGSLHVSGGRTTLGREDFSVWDTGVIDMMLPNLGGARPSRMNCASIEAEIGDGRVTTEALIIDAENVTIAGSGSVDLSSEALDLVLVPSPKHRSLLRGATPVRITGTLAAPQVSVATGDVVASSGVLLLGALNPYLLLGAVVPSPTGEGDGETACGRAVELAEQPPADVERRADELEKAHGGGVTRVLTAPLRALGNALGGGSPEEPAEKE